MKRNLLLVGVALLAVISNVAFAQKGGDASPDAQLPRRASAPLLIKTPGPMDRLQKSPRRHEFVEIDSPGGRKVKTWIVYPKSDQPATVVIMIHENRGLNDWARSAADEMAEAGYVAVAPDLLSGMGPGGGGTAEIGSDDKAVRAISGLKQKQEQVTADLDAVFKYAEGMTTGNKIVAVGGFCWGGGQTFAYATHNPDIASAFVFYGSAPDEDAYKNIKAPVYGFYGGDDFRITGEVPKVEKAMKELGKKYEPVIYKGAKHAFMRLGDLTDDAKDPNRKARDEAWERWTKVLAGLK